jgi:hypothetical protein
MPERRTPGSATRLGRRLVGALCVAALAQPGCGPSSTPGLPWHGSQAFRVGFEIDAAGHARQDLAVDVELDPRRVADLEPHVGSLRVVELGEGGAVLDGNVAFQLVPGEAEQADSLLVRLAGVTAAGATRRFLVYFDARPEDGVATVKPGVSVTEVEDEGQESFRLETPGATWFYHRSGAGFSSLEDADGNDWIGYRPEGGSAGHYRGIPNLVYPEGYFHPGGTECSSRLAARGPLVARIESECAGGEWACRWEIYATHARLTVLRAPRPFWFLYEGTPGGTLDESDRMVLSSGDSRPAAEGRDGDLPDPEWLFFSDESLGRSLFLAHHDDDGHADAYFPMEGNMTVFGFGRHKLNRYLRRTPARFSVGLVEGTDHATLQRVVRGVVEPARVRVGRLERRPDGGA